jgi:hypothetical protein
MEEVTDLSFRAGEARREVMRLPNTGKPIFMCNNILQVVEYRRNATAN